MKKFTKFFKVAKEELNKVIFPIGQQIKQAYLSVFLVVTVVSLFLAFIDMIFSFSISSIIN